ncbi:hypothetical protein TL5118_04052 [Thalassovita autumnalis]|uniref:Uncharacterized protein n=1 Tax=Thalassovita autumnalis TaxID=2072972 RepID=A0A0P1GBG8_9RHOB|nr:hypothetical protein [Thalassovita autumnalis]CUH70077.1 hypothetical protein TL5118_04052 [Thalassovita autumnalis]CUH73501.1 hypothetical protein TL5120_03311 [Thalassovita autumnalis]
MIEGDPCLRTLFLAKAIWEELDEETWNDPQLGVRYGQLEADFDRYVTGDTIPIGMDPYGKGDGAFMARIDPPHLGIWTIRSVAPKPAIRVFGAFCEPDLFVGLITRVRRDLGGPGSREWANAREDAIQRWDNLFPGHTRLTGGSLDDFFLQKAIIV